jgi:hypothetical protein
MAEIPGIIVPAEPSPELDDAAAPASDLEGVVEELGAYAPLVSFPSEVESDEDMVGAFDAMIAAGLFGA